MKWRAKRRKLFNQSEKLKLLTGEREKEGKSIPLKKKS